MQQPQPHGAVPPTTSNTTTMGKVQVGRPAPDFNSTAVVNGQLKEVGLTSYTSANHWLILVFFPKAWSFICPTEIRAFSARLEEFLYSRACAVVFCSTDSEYCLKAWNNTSELEGGLGGIHIPLMSDCNHGVSRDYGVLIEETGVSQRALFIIDPKGVLRGMTVNDVDVGRSVDETLRVLDALRFKDEFGEGCPIDWKKGDAGISTSTPLEGKLELNKKSWSEWARPKLHRAWSGTSQRSISSMMSQGDRTSKLLSLPPPELGLGSGCHSAVQSGQHSPLISPTSAASPLAREMDAVMLAQRMENVEASALNVGVTS
ncbi:hypothetical protein BAUCODRAFT_35516 [Baudoinia panamericana UAMH 10762]|uniref:Thioredoxin domain-containing protein n=1 Tax=Baudoinia panamericana (strain UAMH 10762) TaxID=717646 RepID=M2N5K7_BAUPA|nr:uncharacterized protein BAUCODRAFT_35516 [Baudoinia panamericana UAMH 10762]EMC94329.1 hypothetical protein BAUCODRAFT_35516 [Baudoinia panamericana UAMH 10762]